jgi:type IX secretion system PorP/SprF family membrane protein
MLASLLNAQQDPQFTQWFMDPVTSNIAAAGQSNLTNINAFYRQQWVSLSGAPETILLNVDTRFGESPFGMGLQFYQDEIGNVSNTMIKVGPSFTLNPTSSGTKFSLGLSVSYFAKRFGPSDYWIAIDPVQNDNAIPTDSQSDKTFDIDFGFFMKNSDKFYAGLSTTHLLENSFNQLSIQPSRHFYLMGGYNFSLSGDNFVLRTNFLTKTDLAATAIDFNINALLMNMVWAGVSYRPGDAVAPVIGYQLKMNKEDQISSSEQLLRIGYSYDVTTSKLQTYQDGSHEIFLSYGFMFKSTPIQNKFANPRFL